MNVKANKEYAVNIYLPNGEYWDYKHIKSCVISKARNLAEVITAAHKQLRRRVNGRLHTPESFYFQVCDIEESLIGRYIFRNGKARKVA